jgi:putative intracellular protease/amidase
MDDNNSTGDQREKVPLMILVPLPDHDFDPTESAIPWKIFHSRGINVAFSTEHGDVAEADLHRLRGPLPGLLSAGAQVKAAYYEMTQEYSFQHPIPYAEIDSTQYKAILLPGGDGPRMRQYLGNRLLQSKVLEFWQQGKLVGAICHGILVLSRTIEPQSGRSILYGRKVTALPRSLDRAAYHLDSWFIKHGYIMYPKCVAEEVRACLEHPDDFSAGPNFLTPYVVTDGNLITSRWYMEAELFAIRFVEALEQRIESENK